MKKISTLACFMLLTMVLSACGSNSGSNASPNASAPETEAGSAPSKIVIGLSVPDLSSSFWTSIVYGAKTEAEASGVTLLIENAGGDAKVQDQISQIQNLTQKNVNALIVGATDGTGVAPVVDLAANKGIAVVGLSSPPDTDKLVSSVGTDNYRMGKLLAQGIGAKLNGTGQVAMMAGPAGQVWATKRAQGFEETIAGEFPGIKIVSTDHTGDNRNAALNLMQDWLQRFPDLKAVYTATDDIGAGAADAIEAADKTGSILVASSNLSPVGIDYLKRGLLAFETTQKVVAQGRAAVQQAVRAVKGEAVEKEVVTDVVFVDQHSIASVDFSDISAPEGFKP
ncbi:sugar ABC transporter substrate-binding protein [Paenibacillus beijingensis]|uniref:sugar ABC transporter substrate-binding protein n=1 Tax=Paenibacillus beijingensis TaxID=1126833 RepID=UPI000697B529|nr:substrate-binding domain-containing protein [Paenibacillus beijingensis]